MRKDLKRFGIAESSWYRVAQERGCWRGKCHAGPAGRCNWKESAGG